MVLQTTMESVDTRSQVKFVIQTEGVNIKSGNVFNRGLKSLASSPPLQPRLVGQYGHTYYHFVAWENKIGGIRAF